MPRERPRRKVARPARPSGGPCRNREAADSTSAGRIRIRRFLLIALAAAGVAGCLGPLPRPSVVEHPALRPELFFDGRTRGKGTLELLTGRRRSFQVEGRGYTQSDGSFRLEQVVTFEDGEVDKRTWRMVKLDPGTYTATLSDAAGPVSAEVTGNRFHLRYRLRKPAIYMEQWLYLQPDGRSVLNLGTITLFGIPWARLTEEITKAGAE